MKHKARLMDERAVERALMRISHEIIEHNNGTENVVIVGIISRGKPLAGILANDIEKIEGKRPPCGELNIRFYRDDLSEREEAPVVVEERLPFSVEGKDVVLVDDVIYTGRTARAAIEAVFRQGRPKTVQLAVLVDRGHRELPIRSDYVGKNVPTSRNEVIKVAIPPFDDMVAVDIYDKNGDQEEQEV